MKTILVYGDSNTWGQMAYKGRYPYEQRWTTLLQRQLGSEFEVISSGISGRTAGDYAGSEKRHRGQDAFEYAYLSSYPYAMIVIALGTNDLQQKYGTEAQDIFEALTWYAEMITELQSYDKVKFGRETNPKVLFVLPPNFDVTKSVERSETKRRELIQKFNTSELVYVVVNDLEMSDDGIHFSAADHKKIANKVSEKVKEMDV